VWDELDRPPYAGDAPARSIDVLEVPVAQSSARCGGCDETGARTLECDIDVIEGGIVVHGNRDLTADRIPRCVGTHEAIGLADELNAYPGTGALRERLEHACTARNGLFRHGDVHFPKSLAQEEDA